MRKTALVLIVLGILASSPLAWADAQPQLPKESQDTSQAVAQERGEGLSLKALFSALDTNRSVTAAATAEPYCTRAIDIGGAFCYIGCPEGCQCHVEDWFSQCCCDVSAQ